MGEEGQKSRVHDTFSGPASDHLLLGGSGARRPGSARAAATSWADVPWKTIIGSVGVVLGTFALLELLLSTLRIIAWVAVAGFFAIVLAPLVRQVQRRLGDRRTLATGIVVFTTLAAMVGVVALFIAPVRTQAVHILTDLPGTVREAAQGRGAVGNLVKRLHIEKYVQDNEAQLTKTARQINDSKFQTAQTVLSGALAFVTITLLTFFFLSQGEAMGRGATGLIPARRRASIQRIAVDAAGAVSGYVIGNLLISVIAGVAAFACLVVLGVPSPIVLALFVAVADLIPLVGATLGAAVCVLAAYLHSPTAGLVTLIFFVVYQQVENGVIYPWIMARKVKVNPLVILLSVLVGVELFGILGALLAVPTSGALQVIIKAFRQEWQRDQFVLPVDSSEPLDLGQDRRS